MQYNGEMKSLNSILGIITILTAAGLVFPGLVYGQWSLDFESGLASARYNDVRVPNETGTLFSLTDDLSADSTVFFRFRLGYRLGTRHHVFLFGAPFSLNASGTVDKALSFEGVEFPAGTGLDARYTFNSFRVTYRYDLVQSDAWTVGLGFTAKIRDAGISVSGGGQSAETTNVGFVPLLNFWFQWKCAPNLRLIFEGDALASPGGQGRAEDVFLGGQIQVSRNISVKGGYRLLEGGADVDSVYNFAWINFLVFGITLNF
jgi:hypothetical protein